MFTNRTKLLKLLKIYYSHKKGRKRTWWNIELTTAVQSRHNTFAETLTTMF